MKRLLLVAVLFLTVATGFGIWLLGGVLIHPDTTNLASAYPDQPPSGCAGAVTGAAGGAIRWEPVPADGISAPALEAATIAGRLMMEVRPEYERFPQWDLAELFVPPSSDPRINRIRTRVLAWRLSRGLSVERMTDILVNSAPYGDGTCGIEAASMFYCRKPARMMTPEEGAVLAARMLVPFDGDARIRKREVRYWAHRIHDEMVREGSAVPDFSGLLDRSLEESESSVRFDSGLPPVTVPPSRTEVRRLPPLNRSSENGRQVPPGVLRQ